MKRIRVTTEQVARQVYDQLVRMIGLGKPAEIQIIQAKRTIAQNDMFYALYDQVSSQKGDESPRDIRRYCKLHFGVPILCDADEVFRTIYNKALKTGLTYEEQLESMDFLPVTSNFNKGQGTTYIDDILNHYTAQGLFLADPRQAA